ncbi:UvrD-helicase domain-containing protein [bacterium]|nr:UvrD-helicase domain-containing protein [bacterium]
MSSWLVPREELTPDQIRAVEMPMNEHKVIFGAPGSGKTLTLIHRARFLLDNYNIEPDRFRIFVYTNALKDYIHGALDLLNIHPGCVISFDAWCRDFYTVHINKRPPWNETSKSPDFTAIREGVLKKLQMPGFENHPYDFVLVDEGQDLSPTVFGILRKIAKHVTVCMDHKQQIYDHGSSEDGILKALGLRKRNLSLLEAYRCCPYISQIASTFIDDPQEREAYLRQTKTSQGERETPLIVLATDKDEETDRLIEAIKTRQQKGDRIAILFPQKRFVYGYAKALMEAGLEVEVPVKAGHKESTYRGLDFGSDYPKLMPYHSAKGLTFDSVFLPKLDPVLFDKMSPDRIRNLLFVGITRATRWVYMSTQRGRELPQLDQIKPLVKEKCISMQVSRIKNDFIGELDEEATIDRKIPVTDMPKARPKGLKDLF